MFNRFVTLFVTFLGRSASMLAVVDRCKTSDARAWIVQVVGMVVV